MWSGSNNHVYMYHVFHCFAKKKKIKKKVHHRTDLEADLWPETGDFFVVLLGPMLNHWSVTVCLRCWLQTGLLQLVKQKHQDEPGEESEVDITQLKHK